MQEIIKMYFFFVFIRVFQTKGVTLNNEYQFYVTYHLPLWYNGLNWI
jgi:hypothetical protein